MYYHGKIQQTISFSSREEALAFYSAKVSACRLGLIGWSVGYPAEVKQAPRMLTCGDCDGTKPETEFYDPSASEPACKACADGFWEMMGDDPCGKDWRP